MALLGDIKIMLLKGDKGDKGDGSYDDTEIKQMIEDEAVARETEIAELEAHFLEYLYPVGSIYMSVGSTSPAVLFGGTWEQIKDRFLLADGDTYHAGATGGSATHTPSGTVGNHTLTVNEIPFHEHGYDAFYPSVVSGFTPHKVSTGNYDNYSNGKSKTDNMFDENGVLVETYGQPHNHTFTGTSANDMPPYLTVYIWKRTA